MRQACVLREAPEKTPLNFSPFRRVMIQFEPWKFERKSELHYILYHTTSLDIMMRSGLTKAMLTMNLATRRAMRMSIEASAGSVMAGFGAGVDDLLLGRVDFAEPLGTPLGGLVTGVERCVMGFVPCHALGAGFLL